MPIDFLKKFGMTIEQRERKLMDAELLANPEPRWWYLSYAHATEGFKGGAIVDGYGFVWAVHNARVLGITPRDVETQGMPIPPHEVPAQEYRLRLLTRDEIESFWGAMKAFREYEEEEKKNAE